MKKYFTNIKSMAALLMAGAAFAACSSDDNTSEKPVTPTQKTYTMTVNATKGGNAQTRALSLSDNTLTLTATWATSENVYVKKGETWATGSLKPQTAGTSTTLKGTLSDVTITASDNLTLQFPKNGTISYSGQKGTIADIAANFDYATADVTVASVTDGNITVSGTTEFANQQAIIKFTLTDKSTSTTINPTALTITDGTSTVVLTSIPDATYSTNGAGVLFVAFPATGLSATITLHATVGSNTYTYTKSGVTFTNGKYYAINVKMQAIANAVDLGLPSGRLWASMNVGASSPESYGDLFAWGEISKKTTYNWATYTTLSKGSNKTLTKYCFDSEYGNESKTDNLTVLESGDDAARANWGGDWRMPTKAEFVELINNTTNTWITQNEKNGYKFTSNTNGNSIFLPAAGYQRDETTDTPHTPTDGTEGRYWSSSLNASPGSPDYAYGLGFDSKDVETHTSGRYGGRSVRPVR